MLRIKECEANNQFSDNLYAAFLNKDVMSFWKLWRVKYNGKGCKAAVADGLCEDSDIANCFAYNFKDIY